MGYINEWVFLNLIGISNYRPMNWIFLNLTGIYGDEWVSLQQPLSSITLQSLLLDIIYWK